MKRLHFDYYMQIDYSIEVSKCNFTIKCIPKDNARQHIENIEIELYPNTYFNSGMDGLKNQQIYGLNEDPHNTFFFRLTGDAEAGLSDYEEEEDENTSMIFRHPHGLNVAGDRIKNYYETIKTEQSFEKEEKRNETDTEMHVLKKAEEIMHHLYQDFQYQTNSTTVNTTAEEAFAQGCGVCQDYAHIFIALLHLAGIPARYVTGLLIGEGASHAWVEILDHHKWYGLDPTNNVRVSDSHIKIGIGRDARDCMINRGIMHGGGLHTQTVKVVVNEIKS